MAPVRSNNLPGKSFTAEEEGFIIWLKENNTPGLNWQQIHTRYMEKFPLTTRSKGGLQVHYSRSLQPNARKNVDARRLRLITDNIATLNGEGASSSGNTRSTGKKSKATSSTSKLAFTNITPANSGPRDADESDTSSSTSATNPVPTAAVNKTTRSKAKSTVSSGKPGRVLTRARPILKKREDSAAEDSGPDDPEPVNPKSKKRAASSLARAAPRPKRVQLISPSHENHPVPELQSAPATDPGNQTEALPTTSSSETGRPVRSMRRAPSRYETVQEAEALSTSKRKRKDQTSTKQASSKKRKTSPEMTHNNEDRGHQSDHEVTTQPKKGHKRSRSENVPTAAKKSKISASNSDGPVNERQSQDSVLEYTYKNPLILPNTHDPEAWGRHKQGVPQLWNKANPHPLETVKPWMKGRTNKYILMPEQKTPEDYSLAEAHERGEFIAPWYVPEWEHGAPGGEGTLRLRLRQHFDPEPPIECIAYYKEMYPEDMETKWEPMKQRFLEMAE